MRARTASAFAAIAILAATNDARAATIRVGPSEMYTDLGEVAPIVAAGDVVEVEAGAPYLGGVVFTHAGTADAPITIRGLAGEAGRPIVAMGATGLSFTGAHYVIEGLEITGASAACVYLDADDLTLSDAILHDCGADGVQTGPDASAITLDYVEVFAAGDATGHHGVAFEGAGTARLSHSFVHDLQGGSAIASAAARTEIYSNWIQGGIDHDLDLDGDADVVGNVVEYAGTSSLLRVGGPSAGRYRFVNNTFGVRMNPAAVIEVSGAIESLDVDDDAFVSSDGIAVPLVDETMATWTTGAPIEATLANWIQAPFTGVPSTWAATRGDDPGFAPGTFAELAKGSPLVDAGAIDPPGPPGHALPNPLAHPADLPPPESLQAFGSATPRTIIGTIDIGAFELGDDPDPVIDAGSPVGPPASTTSSSSSAMASELDAGGGCATSPDSSAPPIAALVAVAAGLFAAARAARRRRDPKNLATSPRFRSNARR